MRTVRLLLVSAVGAAACAPAAARAEEDAAADVLPPVREESPRGAASVVVERTKRFEAGASIRAARGLYELVALGKLADELAHGRASLHADAAVGAGTPALTDLREAGPIFDVTARATVRELPIEETTSALTVTATRQIQTGFAWERAGATLGIGAVPRSFFRLGAGYTVAISRVKGPAPPRGADACGTCVIAALDQAATLDLTDPLAPDRGFKIRLDLTEAGGPLGGDVAFVRASPLVLASWPLSDRVLIATRLRLGAILGDAPVYERFFAGGADSVRSYGGGQLSPYARVASGAVVPVGGAGLVLASVEARVRLPSIPTVNVPLGAAVFVDAGRVSVTAADLFAAPPSVAVGAGLRARTPIGDLRLDVGYTAYAAPLPTIGAGVVPPRLERYAVQLAAGEAF
jgi:hypothetical protein